MAVIDYQFSDLLRHPKTVTRDLVDADVLLRRRDEPDVLLMSADRAEVRAESFDALARTIRILAEEHPKAIESALGEVFPWLEFLPTADREAFAEAFARTVVASSAIGDVVPVGRLVREWRATAAIWANAELASALQRPLRGDAGAVPQPLD